MSYSSADGTMSAGGNVTRNRIAMLLALGLDGCTPSEERRDHESSAKTSPAATADGQHDGSRHSGRRREHLRVPTTRRCARFDRAELRDTAPRGASERSRRDHPFLSTLVRSGSRRACPIRSAEVQRRAPRDPDALAPPSRRALHRDHDRTRELRAQQRRCVARGHRCDPAPRAPVNAAPHARSILLRAASSRMQSRVR